MTSNVVLRTQQLTREFSGFVAVDQVNFEVCRGELRAIIGPNGAGKTTFFRLLSGDLRASSGRIWFEDREVTGVAAYRLARAGIGKSYQITNAFPNLTIFENMRIAAQPSAVDFKFWMSYRSFDELSNKAIEILELVNLSTKQDLLAGQLSYGERRRLELGMALGNDPRLLLLDEPTAGMTPKETDDTIELIRRIAQGRTVILVEHKMKVVMTVSDRISTFHQGRILAEGTPAEIRSNKHVQAVYFGNR
jgi:branched-chain amino acid transport system ATP-binding protein